MLTFDHTSNASLNCISARWERTTRQESRQALQHTLEVLHDQFVGQESLFSRIFIDEDNGRCEELLLDGAFHGWTEELIYARSAGVPR